MKIKTKSTKTLLELLLSEAGYATSSKAREVIKNGAVWINDVVVKIPSTEIAAGSTLEINPEKSKRDADHSKYLFKVLFEDEYFIAAAKPPRLKIERTMEGKPGFKDVVLEALQKEKNQVQQLFPINHIDANSTGIVLFAKNQKTAQALEAKAAIKKTWVVLCEGKLSQESGVMNFPVVKNKAGKLLAVDKANKLTQDASTNFKLRRHLGNYSVVEATTDNLIPKQFQAHFQLLGFPVAGEKKYGSTLAFKARNGIHLEKIFFIHPVTGKPLTLQCNLPQSFTRAGRYE